MLLNIVKGAPKPPAAPAPAPAAPRAPMTPAGTSSGFRGGYGDAGARGKRPYGSSDGSDTPFAKRNNNSSATPDRFGRGHGHGHSEGQGQERGSGARGFDTRSYNRVGKYDGQQQQGHQQRQGQGQGQYGNRQSSHPHHHRNASAGDNEAAAGSDGKPKHRHRHTTNDSSAGSSNTSTTAAAAAPGYGNAANSLVRPAFVPDSLRKGLPDFSAQRAATAAAAGGAAAGGAGASGMSSKGGAGARAGFKGAMGATASDTAAAAAAGVIAVATDNDTGNGDASASALTTTDSGSTGAGAAFRKIGLSAKLCTHLASIGYLQPTIIQTLALPALVPQSSAAQNSTFSSSSSAPQGLAPGIPRDCLIKSATGSGKTLAYLLPIIQHLAAAPEDQGIARWARDAGTKALILAPTRELALQIDQVWRRVAKPYYWLIASTLLGGENKKAEKARLRKGVHIAIGTPGRVLDHMDTTTAWRVGGVKWFVLDEADRLMDLGFEESVTRIYETIESIAAKSKVDPADRRRNILVSATLGAGTGLESLAARILVHPVMVGFDPEETAAAAAAGAAAAAEPTVSEAKGEATGESKGENDDSDSSDSDSSSDSDEEDDNDDKKSKKDAANTTAAAPTHATPSTLQQLFVTLSSRHRLVALASFLRLRIVAAHSKASHFKAIVFVSTCASVEFLHKLLGHTFWPDFETAVAAGNGTTGTGEGTGDQQREPLLSTPLWKLHGNLPQKQRTETFFAFSAASEGILFCTDVAARGLDLPAVDWIVQYDAPEDTDDYVHRVGRTARFGRRGQALIFLVESEAEYVNVLQRRSIALTPCPLERILGGLHVGLTQQRLTAATTIPPPPGAPPGTPGQRVPAGAVLQKQLEAMVAADPGLAALAREGYTSFLRAYSAYPKVLKPIFHPKRLHLGEVAHSFALLEKPREIGKKAAEVHAETLEVINPLAAAKAKEAAAKAARKPTLGKMARKADARADVQEFL